MLADDVLENYLKAGQIASKVRKETKNLVKEGTPILKICESVENKIRGMGGEPAFPCNVCVNDIAAHYSSPPEDVATIPKDAIVKVDIGVHIEGYIADTALTVSLSPQYDGMIYAVNKALEQAIRIIQPKIKINRIGRMIQETIESYGFKPVRNLSGHRMSRYILHTQKSIPNVNNYSFQSISEDEVYAIEPFLTLESAGGEVRSRSDAHIYRFQKDRGADKPFAAKLLKTIKASFKSLPFSPRWIEGIEKKNIREAFTKLVDKRCISSYPVLVEVSGSVVAQSEHTIIVKKEGCIVTTL